jgi:mannose-1-phosphate guanylyltransferase
MSVRSVAVVNVGGPSTSNFRALGHIPSPLFQIGGRPLLDHPLRAAAGVPGLCAIYVVGFYDEREFGQYLSSLSAEFGLPVRYLAEVAGHGSAGGLHQFRSVILEEKPEHIFVLNCDVCCGWPLRGARRERAASPKCRPFLPHTLPTELQAAHASHAGAMGTLLATRVPAKKAHEYGEVVADEATGELLHYTERPQTHVSELVNAGVCVQRCAVAAKRV